MFERFSRQARQVVVGAQEEARGLGHDWIGTEHLLLAALRLPEQPGAATLVRLGVSAESCRAAVASVVGGTGDDALGPQDAEALKAFGIDLDEIRRRAENAFGDGALDTPAHDPEARAPRKSRFSRRVRPGSGGSLGVPASVPGPSGHIRFTGRAKKALELSLREAIARRDRRIGVEHLVLALLRGDDRISQGMFRQLGVAPKEMRDLVLADLRPAA
ncbi:Clp protease N-terminal domain-containing protein [Streptomyces sp. WMMB 322]|uniref:Clp protease N-terminal domain-containing protein n=1 Tax=Streptomyces sp. WMMB 322 TaxID=1286821 RepID=UPI0006E22393|nr:Clp protease N-terminal domain-containing protein [Streptomyces sp. WMMB 322]SCK40220.1 Clp amino terminal domain-containing protein, pathogenicity island component [Streptomyces sp. WMMB 322]